MQIFNGSFTSVRGVEEAFGLPPLALDSYVLLFARYNDEGYEGEARVLYLDEQKIFEVAASHCSCFDLDGMWEPVEVTIEALRLRPDEESKQLAEVFERLQSFSKLHLAP